MRPDPRDATKEVQRLLRRLGRGTERLRPSNVHIPPRTGINASMFAVDGVKLLGNDSKSWSGTREELRRKANKMDQAGRVLLSKHRERNSRY